MCQENEIDTNNHLHVVDQCNVGTAYVIDPDITNFPIEKIWLILPQWEVTTKIATFVPIILLGIFGNTIIINLIMRNRSLRTPTNLLIANMAAADMATIAICPILFMVHDFYQNYKLGAFGCKMEGFLEGAMLITGVLNLCALSYDRLTAIVLPMETRLTIRGAKIVMLITWLSGVVIAIPLALYRTYVERQWKNFFETYCKENQTILPKYWHVIISALVWFPLIVMILSYSAIFHKLDRYEKQVLKREHPMCVSYKTKVAKTIFIVVIVFVVLRLPFTVLVFLRYDKFLKNWAEELTPSFHILWYASHYLIFLNAAVNPIIYGLNNDNFRRAYNQTPIFQWLICRKKMKHSKKSRTFGKLFYGVLQPRRPCAQQLNSPKTLSTKINNINEEINRNCNFGGCYGGSKATKTTLIRNLSKVDEYDEIDDHQMKPCAVVASTNKILFDVNQNFDVDSIGFI